MLPPPDLQLKSPVVGSMRPAARADKAEAPEVVVAADDVSSTLGDGGDAAAATKSGFKKRAKAKHRSISCETCHGPLQAHVEDPTTVKPTKITDPKFCTRCHERAPARPEKFPQVVLADHNPGQKCVECHSPHLPTEAP